MPAYAFFRWEIPFAKTGQRETDLKVRAKKREAQAGERKCEPAEVQERIDVLESRQRKLRERMLVPSVQTALDATYSKCSDRIRNAVSKPLV